MEKLADAEFADDVVLVSGKLEGSALSLRLAMNSYPCGGTQPEKR